MTSSNFLDNACTKIQNMAFKTSKVDQIALEYWYNSFLGRLRVDGRGFLHQKLITSAEREVKDSRRSGMYQSYNFLTRLGKQSL